MLQGKKQIITVKEALLLIVLLPALFIAINISKQQQTLQQHAATVGCGNPGDVGNNAGVGKYCTKGGGQCQGTGAPYCALDFQTNVPGICSKPCATDNDCGTGAICTGSGLEKGCEPIACNAPPTSIPTPTQAPTATPSPTEISSPTDSPTATPVIEPTSPISPQGPTPTSTILPTPTPTLAQNATALSLNAFLHGVGNSGDNANPTTNTLSNKSPQHTVRQVTVSIFNASDQLLATKNGLLIYNNIAGAFNGTIDLGSDFTPGSYIVKIKSDGYLRKQLPGIQTIQSFSVTAMPPITLVTGDINGDNVVNALDYNLLIDCFSDLLTKPCDDAKKQITDLNDDGKVNQVDYNLLLREISVQNGD